MMKRTWLICVLCLVAVALGLAFRPPPPISLASRVEMSSHIFVGTAVDLTVVDGKGNVLKPEPPALTNFGSADMTVQINEVLFPSGWKTNGPVKVRLGGAAFIVAAMRKDFLNKKLIYLTVLRDGYFQPSYPWHLTEPLDVRAQIETAIRTNKVATAQ